MWIALLLCKSSVVGNATVVVADMCEVGNDESHYVTHHPPPPKAQQE
jgi:hypothetical protein